MGRQGWREEAGLLGSSGEPSEGVSPFSYTPGLSSSKGSVSEPSESCLGLRPGAGTAKNQRGLTGLGLQKLQFYPHEWAPSRTLVFPRLTASHCKTTPTPCQPYYPISLIPSSTSYPPIFGSLRPSYLGSPISSPL